ncbi:hypothetical protein [Streptomyces halobius]|uniref:Uncharacterized protein n=1 Tax=Streptomyces halobius TaxID=2879846 RepID=A0ABY4MK21_9ACTN|nr:hypothetical protein [Streptomyces halobius]UQA97547.1 hypothetical protein K9S39_41910 [Streptomyces halobius]
MSRSKITPLWKSVVMAAVGASAFTCTTVVPASATAPAERLAASGRYVNVHQCVYSNGSEHYTNVLPNTGNASFNTATNASDTPDTTVQCGAGGGGYSLSAVNSGVYSIDMWDPDSRYLNVHQCVYSNGSEHYTNVLPNTGNASFNTATNASDTPDTTVQCGAGGGGYSLSAVNSGVYSIDMWDPDSRYLNVHQCVYSNGSEHYTNVLPNTGNASFNTATNASDTPDTTVQCGAGGGGYSLSAVNSDVYSIDMWG